MIVSANELASVNAHAAGISDVVFTSNGSRVITCGSDGNLCSFSYADRKLVLEQTEVKEAELLSLDLHPGGEKIAVASMSHEIAIYKLPSLHFDLFATQFSSHGRFVSFSKCNDWLACCSEEGFLKLVDTSDISTMKSWRLDKGLVRSLVVDPLFQFLVALTDGFIHVINIKENFQLLNSIAVSMQMELAKMSFTSSGDLLAVPSAKGVMIFTRTSNFSEFTMLPNTSNVSHTSWNSDGSYLACSSEHVSVYDITGAKVSQCAVAATAFCWSDNNLALIDHDGKLYIWENVINANAHVGEASSSKLKAVPEDKVQSRLKKYTDLDAENEGDQIGEEENSVKPVDELEVTEEELAELRESGNENLRYDEREKYEDSGFVDPNPASMRASMLALFRNTILKELVPKLQESFQSGCTPLVGNQRYLSFNNIGSVVSRILEDSDPVVEVSFSDVARHPKRLQLPYTFEMASLSNTCVIYASMSPSIVVVQQFDIWNGRGEWMVKLEDEARAVAAGDTFTAVGTSSRTVRIFSYSGIQRGLFTIPGDIVTMAATKDKLAIIYHGSAPRMGEQNLHVYLCQIASQTEPVFSSLGFSMLANMPLCISPPVPESDPITLSWIGFSDNGILTWCDSTLQMYFLSTSMGYMAVPLLNLKSLIKGKERIFPIDVVQNQLLYTTVRSADSYPSVHPKPMVQVAPISLPLLVPTSDVALLENSYLMNNIWLAEGNGSGAESDKTNVDTFLMKAVAHACQGGIADGKLMKAFEYASLMHTPKCVLLSKQIAEKINAHQLADRLMRLYEIKKDFISADLAPLSKPVEANSSVDFNDLPRSPPTVVSSSGYESYSDSTTKKRLSSSLINLQNHNELQSPMSKIPRSDIKGPNPFAKSAPATSLKASQSILNVRNK